MKKLTALLLCAALVVSLAGCTQSRKAKDADAMLSTLLPVGLESQDAIARAEEAVNALSPKEKESLRNLSMLETAKNDYQKLLDQQNKLLAKDIDNLIDAIGDVTLDSSFVIETASGVYHSAAPEVQAFVTKYQVLLEAIETFEHLQIQQAEEAIDAIGEVTVDSKEAIAHAQLILANLPAALREKVRNAGVLEEKTAQYLAAEQEALVSAATESGRSRLHVTELACSQPDTAGGVELYFNFLNMYPETIAKIDFGVSFYNEEGNLVMCKYKQQQVYVNTEQGPFYQYQGRNDDGWYWGDYYTGQPVTPVLASLTITYENGDIYTMSPLELEAIVY